jgi:VanZ family protein
MPAICPSDQVGRSRNGQVFSAMEAVHAAWTTAAILLSILYFYASSIPLEFAIPDFSTRLQGIFRFLPFDSEQLFDMAGNVIVFVPLGFAWTAVFDLALPKRSAHLRAAFRAALLCLALSILGEGIQWWLPLRDPLIRDVMALETGAIVGAGLWFVSGSWATATLKRMIERLYVVGGKHLFGFLWAAFLIAVFAVCLILNCYASPSQLFLMYRFREFPLQDIASRLNDVHVKEVRQPWSVLLPSVVATIVIIGLCRIGGLMVRWQRNRACALNSARPFSSII